MENSNLPNPPTSVQTGNQSKVEDDLTLIDLSTPATAIAPVEAVKEEPVEQENPSEESAQAEKKDEVTFSRMPVLEFDTPPHNVELTTPTTVPGEGIFADSLDLPSAASGTQEKLISTFPNLKDVKDPSDRAWASTFMQSMQMVPAANMLDGAFSREGSDWRQGIEINGETIRSAIPRFKSPSNSEISGEQGLQMAFSHMGMGDFFHAAMWNSGFWVTFKPAPEAVWLNINRILGQNVAGISRETYGMLHSSATALAISTVINSILPYVYATSVDNNEMPVTSIPKYLSNHDEHDFIWGFICANYPQGVSIERSCITDPNVCRFLIKEKLQVTELQVTDRAALPEENRLHMRSRSHGSMSLKSVIAYQERLNASFSSVITLKGSSGKEAKLTLAIPSSEKKTAMSNAYIADVQESILATVTDELPVEQREALFDERMAATELRLYQHWVKRIELSDDRNNAITDETTIANTLGVWTRDPVLRTQFFEELMKFINNSTVSAIGMAPAKCPSCGGDHVRPEQRLRGKIDFIPLDVIQVFSYLAEFKTRLILARV